MRFSRADLPNFGSSSQGASKRVDERVKERSVLPKEPRESWPRKIEPNSDRWVSCANDGRHWGRDEADACGISRELKERWVRREEKGEEI